MLILSEFRVFLKAVILVVGMSSSLAHAVVIDLVKNGSLTGAISNGVDALPNNSLPSDWFAGANSAANPNTPDTMDSANNVGKAGLTNFAASPSASPNGGTWVGVARDADTLNENFFQVISGFTVGQTYTLSWYDANFGIATTLSPNVFDPYTGANSFKATLSSLSGTNTFTPVSTRALGTGWEQHSFDFTPQDTTYRLSFALANPTKSYLSIDGISLTTDVAAIPEPQTWVLLILGMTMLWATTRRKKLANIR